MKLQDVLELKSQKDNALVEVLRKAVAEYTHEIPTAWKTAADHIWDNTRDKSVLTKVPLKKISLVTILPKDQRDKKVSGRYVPNKSKILMRETIALRLLAVQLIKHEFAHHLAEVYFNPDKLGNGDVAQNLKAGYVEEWEAEREQVEKESHIQIGDDIDEDWEELFRTGTRAISLYALRTPDEWIAEAFALAWTPGSEQVLIEMRKRFPKTFQAVDAVLNNKI